MDSCLRSSGFTFLCGRNELQFTIYYVPPRLQKILQKAKLQDGSGGIRLRAQEPEGFVQYLSCRLATPLAEDLR